MKRNKNVLKLVYAAVCLALCMVLPLLTMQIPQIGKALSPMHIPVFLCGFLCGWPWGLAVGLIAPVMRSLLFSMPKLYPDAVAMTFELATYGALSGLLYGLLPKKKWAVILSLVLAMLGGRAVWGLARYVFAGLQGSRFPFSAFLAGAFTNAILGIILHLMFVPVIVIALQKSKQNK